MRRACAFGNLVQWTVRVPAEYGTWRCADEIFREGNHCVNDSRAERVCYTHGDGVPFHRGARSSAATTVMSGVAKPRRGNSLRRRVNPSPSARTAVVGLTYATPPCRVGKRPCKQGPPAAPWSRDHTRVKSLTLPARHLLLWTCRYAAPEPPGRLLPGRGAVL